LIQRAGRVVGEEETFEFLQQADHVEDPRREPLEGPRIVLLGAGSMTVTKFSIELLPTGRK